MKRSSVLIVDDFEPWRRLVRQTLEKEGLHVIGESDDGAEALQSAEDLQPDLILLDVGLPTVNGLEVARKVRKACPTSKVVFLTENAACEIAEAALDAGASGYVIKAGMARELMPAIRAALDDKHFFSAGLRTLTFGSEMA